MKDLVFVGVKSNTHRETLEMLQERFQIDVVEPTANALRTRIQRDTPDLILLSLGNDALEESMIMSLLNMDFINSGIYISGSYFTTTSSIMSIHTNVFEIHYRSFKNTWPI